MSHLIPAERIERKIYFLRGHKVMLDSDLAGLYQVETKVLLQGVKRNRGRFPGDFMFQLSRREAASLRSQIVTLKKSGRGRHRKYRPYVFTEQGVAMLSSILRSERAIQVNIQIMRAFTKLRRLIASHRELRRRIDQMEKKYDDQFRSVFDALRELLFRPVEKQVRIKSFKATA